MQEYSNYYFKDLLEAIEEGCQKIGEKRDFVRYLLSMENAESIEKLVEIYDNIYSLLAVFTYGWKSAPKDWYKPESGGYYKPHQIELLNRYFNDNILSLFKQHPCPTKEQVVPYIANLRVCINSSIIQQKILEKGFVDKEKLLSKLGNTRELQYTIRKDIEKIYKQDAQYPRLIQKYRSLSTMLAYYGRVFDVAEIAFAKEHEIDYDAMKEKYEEYLENKKKEEEELELEEERQLREIKKKEKKQIIKVAIVATAFNLVCGVILYYFDMYDISFLLLVWGILILAASCFFGVQYISDNYRKKRGIQSDISGSELMASCMMLLLALCPFVLVLVITILDKVSIVGIIIIIGIIGSLPKLFLTGKF